MFEDSQFALLLRLSLFQVRASFLRGCTKKDLARGWRRSRCLHEHTHRAHLVPILGDYIAFQTHLHTQAVKLKTNLSQHTQIQGYTHALRHTHFSHGHKLNIRRAKIREVEQCKDRKNNTNTHTHMLTRTNHSHVQSQFQTLISDSNLTWQPWCVVSNNMNLNRTLGWRMSGINQPITLFFKVKLRFHWMMKEEVFSYLLLFPNNFLPPRFNTAPSAISWGRTCWVG